MAVTQAMPEDDSLSSPEARRHAAARLPDGLAVLRSTLGIALPQPDMAWLTDRVGAAEAGDPDVFHIRVTQALFPELDRHSDHPGGLAACQSGLVPRAPDVAAICGRAAALFQQSDAALIAAAAERLEVEMPDIDAFASERHFHARENHGFWESLTHIGLVEAGSPALAAFEGWRKPHFERFLPKALYWRDCGFPALHLHALRRLAEDLCTGGAGGPERGVLSTPEAGFGISLGAGDETHARLLTDPLGLVARGALPGLLAGLSGALPEAGRLRLADGSAMRRILLHGRLQAFAEAVTAGAEAVVFIVPTHLRRLRLIAGQGDHGCRQYHVLVPLTRAYELWPAVLAMVLGQMQVLMGRHARLTVFVQAASLALPILVALSRLERDRPGGRMRCFDMGQVLDTADIALIRHGRLTRHAEIVASQPIPFRLVPSALPPGHSRA